MAMGLVENDGVKGPHAAPTLQGWTHPLSRSGIASVLAPPPWHLSGEVVAVDFTVEPGRLAEVVPPWIDLPGDGTCSLVFCDWSAASDHDPRVVRDPARSQYRESYIVVHGSVDGRSVGRVPFIWVDNDLSLVRGFVQGFPKKLGQIYITRPVELGSGGAKKEVGGRFAAHVSSLGRRLSTAAVSITEQQGGRYYPRAVSAPLLHTRVLPSLETDRPTVYEKATGTIADFQVGTVYTGDAELEIGRSEFEELDIFEPVTIGMGYVFSMAFSVLGGTEEPLDRQGE